MIAIKLFLRGLGRLLCDIGSHCRRRWWSASGDRTGWTCARCGAENTRPSQSCDATRTEKPHPMPM